MKLSGKIVMLSVAVQLIALNDRPRNDLLCVETDTNISLYNQLSDRFDNRLYHVNKHPTGCQAGFTC